MPDLSSHQLKAIVTSWRQRPRWEDETIFATRTDFPYEGAPEIDCDGFMVRVAECRSDLEARERLLEFEKAADSPGLLLLVRTGEDRIGEDVLASFAGRSLLPLDQREVLMQLYGAAKIDPRISSEESLLEALVLAGSSNNGRKAPGGVLDLDFAWSVVLRRPELMNQRPDLVEILEWSLDEERWMAVKALDEALVPPFFEWVGERAGGVAACLKSLFDADEAHLYLPLGLLVGDLHDERLNGEEVAKDARVRLETYFSGRRLRLGEAMAWRRAAREVMLRRPPEDREQIAGSIDAILEGIKATSIAAAITFSREGFKERWRTFAEDLDRLGSRKWENGSRALFDSLTGLKEHGLAPLHANRIKCAEMAARLAVYEARPAPPGERREGLPALARTFARNDSFVDRARFALSWGDPQPEVAKVYAKLNRRLTKTRIEGQIAFGERLRQWHVDNEEGSADLLPIEQAVAKCVAPLAAECPVLLLVMDGMHFPAFHQLSESLERAGWAAQEKKGGTFPTKLLSVLPSVTKQSRWALFSGKVQHEQRRTEPVAFREHPALQDLRGRGKPVLFTMSDLGSEESAALSPKVRDMLAETDHRVVALVINAIDDQLSTGGQLSVDWEVNAIGILPAILEAAAEGRRALVLTSDHGHIPEMEGTRTLPSGAEGEARFHYGEVGDAMEREFTGQRVEAATGGKAIVMPITEAVRYGRRAAGYHGGACDLEVVIPLAVFTLPDQEIQGYESIDIPRPEWWDLKRTLSGDEEAKLVTRIPKKKAKKKAVIVDELPLFAGLEASTNEVSWLDAFFESPVFAEQERMLGRAGPNKEHLRQVLAALDAGGGSLLIPALARKIGEASFRIGGMLSRIERFMNVDGYEVMEIDRNSDTVKLHRGLLAAQFQVKV